MLDLVLFDRAQADGYVHCAEFVEDLFAVLGADVRDHVAVVVAGAQELALDVDAVVRQDAVMLASTPGTVFCRWMRRCVPGTDGSATFGMLTDIAVAPVSAKSASLPDTNSPMSCCASSVEPPMCGVRMTFGRPRSSETNSSPFAFGSLGKTSMAAPAMWPDSMCLRSAAWSTTNPRERFRNRDLGFIRENSSSPKNPWLPGRPSTWMVTVSTDSRSSFRVEQRRAFPMA